MALDKSAVKLKRASSPEAVGVKSAEILNFINYLEEHDIQVHSFMVLRHGIVAAEAWWKPFAPDIPHAMFSLSKSITVTAIGFAIQEGLISVEDNVYKFFVHDSPAKLTKNAKMLKIKHLLTMSSGKTNSFMMNTEFKNWVRRYLAARFFTQPGKKFKYATENTYMLSAIINRVTGMSEVEYLTPRLFDPLGIELPVWETDEKGVEAGGWGLYLKTEDQAKFIQCYLDKGMWNGKQIIPKEWAETVTEKHIDNYGIAPDYSSGYGYQFWRCSLPNTFRCDGMFSQFAIAMKDYDACIVTNSGEPIEHETIEAIWKFFPKAFADSEEENPEEYEKLKQKINSLSMEKLPSGKRRPAMEKKINNRHIKFNLFPFSSVLSMPTNYVRAKRTGEFNNVKFNFNDKGLELRWTEKFDKNAIDVSFDGEPAISIVHLADSEFHIAAQGAWLDDGSLEIWIRPIETTQMKKLNFSFNGKKVKLTFKTCKGFGDIAISDMDFNGYHSEYKALRSVIRFGADKIVEPAIDPELKGVFYD